MNLPQSEGSVLRPDFGDGDRQKKNCFFWAPRDRWQDLDSDLHEYGLYQLVQIKPGSRLDILDRAGSISKLEFFLGWDLGLKNFLLSSSMQKNQKNAQFLSYGATEVLKRLTETSSYDADLPKTALKVRQLLKIYPIFISTRKRSPFQKKTL